ncbi:hypothetical protein BDV25DRAFT_138675 [Aspergillus avenaceus]|uniref:Uncharacterized protein n=1 Tax=Aspergillus avenaceus TaxID=36643 RepID=A0A5N6TZX0_ASPAV|nr:hypothetical protein BDV25DRAFT_138675 [Aspergillus avenaceus]
MTYDAMNNANFPFDLEQSFFPDFHPGLLPDGYDALNEFDFEELARTFAPVGKSDEGADAFAKLGLELNYPVVAERECAVKNDSCSEKGYTALDSLLRSTSQLATQRALYMTTPQTISAALDNTSSPHHNPLYLHSFDDCSSPATITSQHFSSSGSEGDWEEIAPRTPIGASNNKKRKLDGDLETMASMVYPSQALTPDELGSLPELELSQGPGQHKRRRSTTVDSQSTVEDLTPLEMPDGSTRFTANWLPVDPSGGFTIGMPEDKSASHYAAYESSAGSDPMAEIGREAFLSVGD